MIKTAMAEAGVLRAEEVAMLGQVYDEITSAPQYLGDKPACEALAKKILQMYESGVTDPYELKRICGKP